MKPGARVKTPDGVGTVIPPIGIAPNKTPILVQLDKMMGYHHNWYYSASELKVIQ